MPDCRAHPSEQFFRTERFRYIIIRSPGAEVRNASNALRISTSYPSDSKKRQLFKSMKLDLKRWDSWDSEYGENPQSMAREFCGRSSWPWACPEAVHLLFRTPRGEPINADSLAKHFKAILKQACLPELRLYDLRHTAATIALAVGVSPKVVSEQLGHASTAFTLDTYAHVLPHMQDEAVARIEAVLVREWAMMDN